MIFAVPLAVLLLATTIAAFLPGARGVAASTERLKDIQAETRRWRVVGFVLGAGAALATGLSGGLGRGLMLAAPVFAVFVLAGVVFGELRVTAPAGAVRRV